MLQPITDDIEYLLAILPKEVAAALVKHPLLKELLEVILDLGKPVEARFPKDVMFFSEKIVGRKELDTVAQLVGTFTSDNRAGIERTLHRISCIRNRSGEIIGLTCRIGRAIYGTIDIAKDVIETGKNILFLGRPGIGKTTKLREAARVLADDFNKRVVIVDTSNEIGGDGDIPHPAIGKARRMQVPNPDLQHAVMIEAVENHMPEVIFVDEIGTEAEAKAARTIAERGVQLIGTAHGNELENVLKNPTLSDLLGGIQTVILGDEEARRRHTQKAILERKASPTFDVVIELRERDKIAIYHDTGVAVDHFLRGFPIQPEVRVRTPDGKINITQKEDLLSQAVEESSFSAGEKNLTKIYPYAINREKLARAIQVLNVPADIVRSLEEADFVLTVRTQAKSRAQIVKSAGDRRIPVHVLRANSSSQIQRFLRHQFKIEGVEEDELALQEAEQSAQSVLKHHKPVELMPQNAYVRRLQHLIANQYGLETQSIGEEPYRHLCIYPKRT